jgi:hypothetical protein
MRMGHGAMRSKLAAVKRTKTKTKNFWRSLHTIHLSVLVHDKKNHMHASRSRQFLIFLLKCLWVFVGVINFKVRED